MLRAVLTLLPMLCPGVTCSPSDAMHRRRGHFQTPFRPYPGWTNGRHLSAVRNLHVGHGYPDPTLNAALLQRVMRGINHVHGSEVARPRLPITMPVLVQLLRALQGSVLTFGCRQTLLNTSLTLVCKLSLMKSACSLWLVWCLGRLWACSILSLATGTTYKSTTYCSLWLHSHLTPLYIYEGATSALSTLSITQSPYPPLYPRRGY